MSETSILQNIRLDLGLLPEVKIFRNNTGALRDDKGRPVTFGLHPGSPDLVGWRTVIVTPEMVGKPLAVFLGIEVKTRFGRPTEQQQLFLETVRSAGGMAGVARSPDQARFIAGLKP